MGHASFPFVIRNCARWTEGALTDQPHLWCTAQEERGWIEGMVAAGRLGACEEDNSNPASWSLEEALKLTH